MDVLQEYYESQPAGDLAQRAVRLMLRSKSTFDSLDLKDKNWTNAQHIRHHLHERRWDGFWEKLQKQLEKDHITLEFPWTGDEGGARLKAELEKLAVQLETSHIITNG